MIRTTATHRNAAIDLWLGRAVRVIATTVALFLLLMLVLASTRGITPPPEGEWISRAPVYYDYSASLTAVSSPAATQRYVGETAFWTLMRPSWRAQTKWRLVLPGGSGDESVTVRGERLNAIRTDTGPWFEIPHRLVSERTPISISSVAGDRPRLALKWTRSHVSSESWWVDNGSVIAALAIGFYLLVAALAMWGWRQSTRILERKERLLFGIVVSLLVVCAIVTTNFDLQLFKGYAERFWVYGPVPGLTLTGYGPIADFAYLLPATPYLFLLGATGWESEFALNLAFRIPFIAGWIFLVGATLRLGSVIDGRDGTSKRTLRLLLIANPLVFFTALLQPEALLVGLLVLSVALLVEGRAVPSGVMFGLAVLGKYWPLFAAPVLLLFAWKHSGKAGRWVAASFVTIVAGLALHWSAALSRLQPAAAWALLKDRMPFFGGADAPIFASYWSLYRWPKMIVGVASGAIEWLESVSFLVAIVLAVTVAAMLLRRGIDRWAAIAGVGAIAAFVAGLNSLSVPQFGIWALPFVGVLATERAGGVRAARVAFFAGVAGTLVFLFSEPLSYWLLHSSPQLDELAYGAAGWLRDLTVSHTAASAAGFAFTAALVVTGVASWRIAVTPPHLRPSLRGLGEVVLDAWARVVDVLAALRWFARDKTSLPEIASGIVVDVGSGHSPHLRAHILVDKHRETTEHRLSRFAKPRPRQLVLWADATRLPLKDAAAGFVIASHVLEHLERPNDAVAEIERVGRAGYIECPSRWIEVLFPFPPHLWYVSRSSDGSLLFEAKDTARDRRVEEALLARKNTDRHLRALFRDRPSWTERVVWAGRVRRDTKGTAVPTVERSEAHPPEGRFMAAGRRIFVTVLSLFFRPSSLAPDALFASLCCPFCRSDVELGATQVDCSACGRSFARRGMEIDFLDAAPRQ